MEWIKSSEKLPENGERVLVSSIYGIQIGWLTVNNDWQFCNGGHQFAVEYWMSLPDLPCEGKESTDEPLTGNCIKPAVIKSEASAVSEGEGAVERPCYMCHKEIGNDVFTVCDDCWDISRQVSSEQP